MDIALAGGPVFSAWLNAGAATSPELPFQSRMKMGLPTRTPVSKLSTTPVQTPTGMGGQVMPPGMTMTGGTSLEAMQDMAAVDLSKVSWTAPATARGDRPLTPRPVNGVKVYSLETSLINWNILPGVQVAASAANRQVTGPRIHLTEGDRVRFVVKNARQEATTIHWHGLSVPDSMDGAGSVTQKLVPPGGSFTYEFTVHQARTVLHHSQTSVDRQQGLGLYGALIVDPRRLSGVPPGWSSFVDEADERPVSG